VSHKHKLVALLKQHMEPVEIKRMSNELRDLNICNLQDPQVAEKLITPEGVSILFSFITFSKTGIFGKIIDIKGLL